MRKILTITFITLLILLGMAINVQAAEVTTWEGLVDELANGTDQEVTLNGDVTITDSQTLNLNAKTLILNKKLVVDAGNLTITGNGTISTEVADPAIDVKKGSTLMFDNATIDSTTYYGAAIQVTGGATDDGVETKVTVGKNANITANYPVYITKDGAFGVTIDVYGDLKSITTTKAGVTKYGAALYINGKINATTGNVPVINVYEGAKVVAEKSTAVYAAGFGIWNISGGYFEGTEALSIKGGEFYITGGTFHANGEYVENPEANNDGSEDTGSAISITGNDGYAGKIVLEISNATVTSENGYAIYETITKAIQPAVESMEITSGDYSGKEGAVQADNIENFIQGGTFSSDVAEEYLSTDVDSAEEEGVVLVGTKHSIKIENVENGSVTTTLTEAIKGQKVELTVTPKDGYKVKEIKVNGVLIEGTSFIMLDEDATVTAEFEEVLTSGEEISIPEPEPEEKDNTPKTGSINIPTYVWLTLAIIAVVGIATTKKPGKHVK